MGLMATSAPALVGVLRGPQSLPGCQVVPTGQQTLVTKNRRHPVTLLLLKTYFVIRLHLVLVARLRYRHARASANLWTVRQTARMDARGNRGTAAITY